MKIRAGDTVQVMSGKQKDRGVRADVEKVILDTEKVLVKGVNIVTRHIKKT
jgi:large subunit ribosomal protein L24